MYSGKRVTSPVPYPSTAISSFLGEVKNLLQTKVYNKFKHVFIGSYNKAVQYLEQLNTDPTIVSEGGMYNKKPFLVFTPTLEQPVDHTNWLWNYTNMHPYMAYWNRPPILFEDGTLLALTTRRMQGNIDLKIFTDSLPEAHDIQMSFFNFFRGLNSVVPMNMITLNFVLSDKIKMLTDNNEEIVLDLNHSNISHKLIKNTGRHEYVMPIATTPTLRLTALSDSSSFYGGTDLAEFALSGSLQYELEIPANINLHTNMQVINILANVTTTVGSVDSSTSVGPDTVVDEEEPKENP
jgi:hypothetical protein